MVLSFASKHKKKRLSLNQISFGQPLIYKRQYARENFCNQEYPSRALVDWIPHQGLDTKKRKEKKKLVIIFFG